MKLLGIPLLFTAIVLTIGFFVSWAKSHDSTAKWEHWDTIFVTTLLTAVALPTWSVYFSPHWPVPLGWTVVAIVIAHFAPYTNPSGLAPILSKPLQYAIAGVSAAIGWMTYMMIFCETHWRQVT